MTTPWQKHRKKWQSCGRCLLRERARKVVLARGDIPCEILLVGEAPGASEDVLGRPFVGPAGKLLDHILTKAWDGKVHYALTNLVACVPKDDDGKLDEPPEESILACAERVQEMIEMTEPKAIIAVGKLAQKYLDGKADAEIIHPAAILRMDDSQMSLAVYRCIAVLRDAADDYLVPF